MSKPAIVVIAYNREESLKRLLDYIDQADYSSFDGIDLVISIDYWKKNNPCYRIADEYNWRFGRKRVIKHKKNLGLKEHILLCGDMTETFGSIILLEDDIIVSPAFYKYAAAACEYYKCHEEVMGVGLYSSKQYGATEYPFEPEKNGKDTYYEKWVVTWGECFNRDRWREFREWYSRNSGELREIADVPHYITHWEKSWSKYLAYYMNERNLFFVSPYESYSSNYHDKGIHQEDSNDSAWQTVMQLSASDSYDFSNLGNAIKYDSFHERMDLEHFRKILRIETDPVLDLYGQTQHLRRRRYCLSTRVLPYRIVKSYGLVLHPIEENVFREVPGKGIYLYDMSDKCRNRTTTTYEQKHRMLKYYYPLIGYRSLIVCAIFDIKGKILNKLSRYIK